MKIKKIKFLRKRMLEERLTRANLQNDSFFVAVISVCLDCNIYTQKELAGLIADSKSTVRTVKLWKKGQNLPPPVTRAHVFRWIREDIDKKISRQK